MCYAEGVYGGIYAQRTTPRIRVDDARGFQVFQGSILHETRRTSCRRDQITTLNRQGSTRFGRHLIKMSSFTDYVQSKSKSSYFMKMKNVRKRKPVLMSPVELLKLEPRLSSPNLGAG
jgi:hypothetical protein